MKQTIWMKVLLAPAVMGALLIAGCYAFGAEDGNAPEAIATNAPVPVATNAVTAVSSNLPVPAETVLEITLPEDVDPASPFAQLVRMVQAGVDKEVMQAYIKSSPRFFELDADDIIYLTDLGTPPEVIQAAIARDQELFDAGISTTKAEAPSPAAETVDEEPPQVTVDEFYDTLSPYGTWVNIEGYGRCWRPAVVTYDSNWQPYCDNGRWVYTDHGWYWMSNYSWGWATFHYGRWFHNARYGWIWWPDTVWAPSWVYWRYNTSYCGWAPLPPYTAYRSGVGWVYRGSVVSVGFNFDLGLSSFTFVSTRNFCDPNPRRYIVDRRLVRDVYDRTRGDCRYDIHPRRHTIINHGIPVTDIQTATQRSLQPVSVRYSRNRTDHRYAAERLDRTSGRLVVDRPHPDRTRRPPLHKSAPVKGAIRSSSGSTGQEAQAVRPPRVRAVPSAGGNRSTHPSQPVRPSTPSKRQSQPGSQTKQRGVIVPAPANGSNSNRGSVGSVQPGTRTQQPPVVRQPAQRPRPAAPAPTKTQRVAPPKPQANPRPHVAPANRSVPNSTSGNRGNIAPQQKRANPPARVTTPNSGKRPQPKQTVRPPRTKTAPPPATTRSTKSKSNKSDEKK